MAVQDRNAAAVQLYSSDLIQNQGELHLSLIYVTAAMSPYAANKHSVMIANAAAGPITITLPLAVNNYGKVYAVKKMDATANVVTVACSGADLIDGAANQPIAAQYDAIILVSDGISNWWLISLV